MCQALSSHEAVIQREDESTYVTEGVLQLIHHSKFIDLDINRAINFFPPREPRYPLYFFFVPI